MRRRDLGEQEACWPVRGGGGGGGDNYGQDVEIRGYVSSSRHRMLSSLILPCINKSSGSGGRLEHH